MVGVLHDASPFLEFPATSLTSIKSVIVRILAAAVKDLDFDTADERLLIDLIRLCHSHQAKNCVMLLFTRADRHRELDADFWLGVLESLAHPEAGNPINLVEEPYGRFAGAIISKMTAKYGSRPPPNGAVGVGARTIECSTWCNLCRSLRTFFQSEQQEYCFHQVGAESIDHVKWQIDRLSEALRERVADCNIQMSFPRGVTVSAFV